jgi:hypothetical protein
MKTYLLTDPDGEQSPFTTAEGEMASSYAGLGWHITEMVPVPELADLRAALAFLDQCRASPKEASEAACFKDVREWLESAARKVAAGEPVSDRDLAESDVQAAIKLAVQAGGKLTNTGWVENATIEWLTRFYVLAKSS